MYVIDHDPIVDRPKIIGLFETKEDADLWGQRNITNGVWHSMPLTPATNAATGSSALWTGSATRVG